MLKAAIAVSLASVIVAAPSDRSYNSINEFSLNLLQNVYAYQENFGPQNFALSALSVWNIFALLSEGAAGMTYDELSRSLRLPQDSLATKALHISAEDIFKRNHLDVILKKQSALFADNALRIHQDFCRSAAGYNTDVFNVDTRNSTRLADDINLYICLATDGRIRNAVTESLLADLRLLIIDVMYFKANWTFNFDASDTRQAPFYDQQVRVIGNVNMMYQKANSRIETSDSLQAEILELTYGMNNGFSMFIFLPFYGVPLSKIISNLATQPLYRWLNKFKMSKDESSKEYYVPRFKITSELDLVQPLKYTGLYTIFDDSKSELPGISDIPLFVSKTVQKIDFEVTEEGTIAAAVTLVGLENRVLTPPFEANRPFVFMIVDKSRSVILFSGVYVSPSVF